MNKNYLFVTLSFLGLFLQNTFADTKSYLVTPAIDGNTGVDFSIGYTAGTHEGSALLVKGNLSAELNPFSILNAEVIVPIENITTGNDKRDCHLRESLGLNYANTSTNYPDGHVCDSSNNMPKTGGDSVVYPEIKFTFTSLQTTATTQSQLLTGKPVELLTSGTFEMHGVKQNIVLPLQYTFVNGQSSQLKIDGNFKLVLVSYGIIVKNFLFIKVDNSASNPAEVQLHLNLSEVK